MLEAYAVNQTFTANSVVPFTSVSLIKGETAVLTGTSSIQLNRAGVYMVTAVFTGTPAAAGAATIQMTKDGVVQPQATITDPTVLTTVGVTLPISTLVQVSESNSCCCCKAPTVLQFVNAGVGLNNAASHVTVTKIC